MESCSSRYEYVTHIVYTKYEYKISEISDSKGELYDNSINPCKTLKSIK